MAPRLELQELLVGLLGSDHVYFQPPPSIDMLYPCIVYHRDAVDTTFADDRPYGHRTRYQVTVITQDPDSDLKDKVAALPACSYDRFFTNDNLNHDVYNLFF